MEMKELLKKLLRQKRGIVGLEAAIVLIAFVIIAAAFSFMVVNQGLFATERGKAVVQEGLQQASTPLSMDGTIFLRTVNDNYNVSVIVIPLRAFGVDYVAIWKNETVVTLKIGTVAWGNIYSGVLYDLNDLTKTFDPTGLHFDKMLNWTTSGGKVCTNTTYTYDLGTQTTKAALAIENSNHDEALNSDEKGYLIITLDASDCAQVRDKIVVEIRLEKTAPLSIEFNVPESMDMGQWLTG
jgi:flagellin FlaB